jgi:hypothetical protein
MTSENAHAFRKCLQLPEQLKAPFLAAVEKGDIRKMPNQSMAANPMTVSASVCKVVHVFHDLSP